ncbi:MAG: PqqD family protein [Pyrinomonadaceae bacterium]|nr:PqqD family protein [Pyrinomonadaceae bacterium]
MLEASLSAPLVARILDDAMTITDNSIIAANKELLCCDLSEGAVILDLKSGVYYGLDAVGTYIWGLIQEPKTIDEITNAVLDEYAVEPERCLADLKVLFKDMAERNLIEVRR